MNKDKYLRIKVIPKAEKNCISEIIEDEEGQTIKIRIKAPPEKGKANKELIKFLSNEFSLPKQNIEIISGKTSQLKLLKITWD
ncbi:YggU family protein [Candidatus Peregrinibacteria bacterium RIFCSPLOWO2_01_FULL_39_12]|nr:MAG: YggU family protein [Candidatus Peregrinibacteria bacterium RIFCSPLOWO2_01_FULL_39_12]